MKFEAGMAAVVTGGASGLGRASAQALADHGLKVAIFDINEEDGKAHADALGGTFHHVNIMDEQSVEDGFAAARAANGQERVTVHCAMASRRGKTIANHRTTDPDQKKQSFLPWRSVRAHPGSHWCHLYQS